jgi:hypothetical protein
MKKLLSTTAMVVALGFPALTLAQTTPPAAEETTRSATDPVTGGQSTEMSAFLAERGQFDINASELMGHDVHARRVPGERDATGDQPAANADGSREMATMRRADLEEMDVIGQITEIVLSHDGQVRALVIGVGGFLGMGEQDVAVTMDQVTISADADDRSEMYIVVRTGVDLLKTAPAYDRMTRKDAMDDRDETRAERMAFPAPRIERKGYTMVEMHEVTTEMMMDKAIHDVSDNEVGNVTDMIVDDAGKITHVVIDFGGFLGMGSSQAKIGFEELTILSTSDRDDVRIYVDATKEQIRELPRYQAGN